VQVKSKTISSSQPSARMVGALPFVKRQEIWEYAGADAISTTKQRVFIDTCSLFSGWTVKK
jgi:hypothetical protein